MKDKELEEKIQEESKKLKKLIAEGWKYVDTTVTGNYILEQGNNKIIYDSKKDIVLKEIHTPEIIEEFYEKKEENPIEKNQKIKFSDITDLKAQAETTPYQDSQNIPQKQQPNNSSEKELERITKTPQYRPQKQQPDDFWKKELERIRNEKERTKQEPHIKKSSKGISFLKEYDSQ